MRNFYVSFRTNQIFGSATTKLDGKLTKEMMDEIIKEIQEQSGSSEVVILSMIELES